MAVPDGTGVMLARSVRMLRTALGPAIAALLGQPDIVEVMLNPDGRLWVDRLGAGLADTGLRMLPADGEPLSAVWAGPERNAHLDGPPLLIAHTAGSTPFRLVPHQGDVGHSLIVGPTGAGKTVLLALIALQFRRYPGARVVIFDKGRSSKAAVLGMGGAFHDLALGGEASHDQDHAVAFQPEWRPRCRPVLLRQALPRSLAEDPGAGHNAGSPLA